MADKKADSFPERSKKFNEDVMKLQKKHNVTLYAANVVVNKENEVAPVVRIGDGEDKNLIVKDV